jgi:murein DD-endopeptidase MepM/ murein hydrolase activator NlpD
MRIRRVLTAALASAALVVGISPFAMADDPAARKQQVDASLAQLKGAMAETTQDVADAAAKLQAVQADLDAAQQALSTAQGQLAAAKAEDARLAEALVAAKADEGRAEAELAGVQTAIATSRDRMASMATAAYQGQLSGLGQMSIALDADSPAQFVDRMQGIESVLRSQSATIATLADSRAAVASSEAHLQAVRERTADLRQQAADNLVTQTKLEAAARDAAAAVAAKRAEQASILASAQSALAAEQKQYEALTAERKKLEAELAARAAAAARAKSSQVMSSGVLYRPVLGPITSPYGMRVHPITHIYKLHDGTDFGAGCGTAIRAAASGRVLRTAYSFGYGNQTVIEHGVLNGKSIATSYSHQSRFGVHPGQYVTRGQVIGYVGATGYATGCHLHFMVYVNGHTVDPMTYL